MSALQLSVVIASHDASSVIVPCLEALADQVNPPSLEIIVADSSTDGTDTLVRRAFPDVRLLHVDEPLGVPQLRGRAIARARGEVIAILDPFAVVDRQWAREVMRAHADHPNLVIGGQVDLHNPDTQSFVAWAIYLNEYGMFMPPTRGGGAPIVPGCNVSYKRAVLFIGDRPRHQDFWKTFVNWDAEAQGSPLLLEPRMIVALNKPVAFSDFLRTRSWHGRCFAGTRMAGANWWRRWLRAGSTPLVPILLCFRWARVFWPKGPRRGIFLLTLPLQFVLFGAWAWGELLGYLRGSGDTCGKLYY